MVLLLCASVLLCRSMRSVSEVTDEAERATDEFDDDNLPEGSLDYTRYVCCGARLPTLSVRAAPRQSAGQDRCRPRRAGGRRQRRATHHNRRYAPRCSSPRLASPHACLAVAPDWLKVFQPYILAPSQSLSLGVDALTNERNKVASRCAFVVVVLLLRLTRAGVD